MLQEQPHVRQVPGEPRRRWFLSEQFDLILWVNADGSFAGFELCYDRGARERSLVWRVDTGFSHMKVESGADGRHMATPLLVAEPRFEARRVHEAFSRESATLPPDVARYVAAVLASHPEFSAAEE